MRGAHSVAMGRVNKVKGRDTVGDVDAQTSVGQQSTPDGNRGCSPLDLEALRSLPRHHRSGKIQHAQREPSRRSASHRPDNLVQSLARVDEDNDDVDISPTSVMPPPSQRRLNRSATVPLEERRQYGTDTEVDEADRLALVRRHSERLESPRRTRRHGHMSPSDTEPDTETGSDEESDHSEEIEVSDRIRNVVDVRDLIEEADDEAPMHRRRRSDGKAPLTRKATDEARRRDGSSIRSYTEEASSSRRELVPRSGHGRNRQSDDELEHTPRSRVRHGRRSGKAPETVRARPSSHRTPKRGEQSNVTAHNASHSQQTSTVASSRSSTTSVRRPTNVLSSFFKAPTPPKKHSKPGASGSAQRAPAPSERVECIVCMSDVSVKRSAHLKCDHNMCNSCLRRAFTLSVADAAHMPPKCCTKDHIPLRHVERLFDRPFKRTWNRRFTEYTTKNRLYCPAKRCGHFIKPSRIKGEKGRRYARCGRCQTKVCADCNSRWHKTAECPKDDSLREFLGQAKERGWQRCYSCKAMVELREGCNHMTCICTAEFCMICGTKWKGCDCPWFSDEAVAADRRANGSLVEEPASPPDHYEHHQDEYGYDYDGELSHASPGLRDFHGHGHDQIPTREQRRIYEEDLRINHRRLAMGSEAARGISAYGNLDDDYARAGYDLRGAPIVMGVAPHPTNYHYQHGGEPAMSHAVPPLQAPYDRSLVADYVSDVSRARGMREDSMERRLAERLGDRSILSPASVALPSGSPMGPHSGVPPMYSYPNMAPSGGIDPVTGMPMLHQTYAYSATIGHGDPRYNGMQQASPSNISMPNYADYACWEPIEPIEPRAIEVNAPRRRRRERERAAAATTSDHGRRISTATASLSEVKSSSLAGLTGPGRGMDRVAEWSYHVAPGMPGSTVG